MPLVCAWSFTNSPHAVLDGGVVQQATVSSVLVGIDRRARAHAIRDEPAKGRAVCIGHDSGAHAASRSVLDACDGHLADSSMARPELLTAVLVLLLAADERLICFGWTSEQVTILKVLSNPVRQEPRAFLRDPKLSVKLHGRDPLDVAWIYGVQPGDLSAGGEHFGEAHADFRQSFTTVLYDIADDSLSKEDFRTSVKSFFSQENKPLAEAWREAVDVGRAAGRAFALKKKVPIGSADTPPSLQISFEVKANELEAGLEIVAA